MWYIVAWFHHWYAFESQKHIARNMKYKHIAHGLDAGLHWSKGADILIGSATIIR